MSAPNDVRNVENHKDVLSGAGQSEQRRAQQRDRIGGDGGAAGEGLEGQRGM